MDRDQYLSIKQQKILTFISEYYESNGISPTIDDVKLGCKISSKSVVSYNLGVLEKKGLLDRKKGLARSITRIENNFFNHHNFNKYISIPLVNTISAGIPLEISSPEEIYHRQNSTNESIEIPCSLTNGKTNLIGLRINGDSMTGDSIEDGDIVIIESSSSTSDPPKQGEMVVARLNNDTATLKRFYKKGGKIELRPSNNRYSPIIEDQENVIIEGRVIALIRKF